MSVYSPDIVMVKDRVGLRQEERRATLSAQRVLGSHRAELLASWPVSEASAQLSQLHATD